MREGARYLLTNPFYIGLVRHGADLYPGMHEPLLSQELQDVVQAIRARRGEGKGGGFAPAQEIHSQVAELVSRLILPDDWRERLEEFAEHQEELENVEGKPRWLKFLFMDEGDMTEGEYRRRKADLQAQLDALRMLARPEVEQAEETLENLGQECASWLSRVEAPAAFSVRICSPRNSAVS
jgi:hypothetical protein